MTETAVHEECEPHLPKNEIRAHFEFPVSAFRLSQCRRQPEILFRRNNFASASSGALFPRERMRDITSERLALVKTSGIFS
jgi:hypothetical protein